MSVCLSVYAIAKRPHSVLWKALVKDLTPNTGLWSHNLQKKVRSICFQYCQNAQFWTQPQKILENAKKIIYIYIFFYGTSKKKNKKLIFLYSHWSRDSVSPSNSEYLDRNPVQAALQSNKRLKTKHFGGRSLHVSLNKYKHF